MRRLRRPLALSRFDTRCAALCVAAVAACAAAAAFAADGAGLPDEVSAALARAGVPEEALSVALLDAASGRAVYRWREQTPRNPGSLVKLATTAAALDRLGPAWTWATPVWLAGPVRDGVLEGSLHLKGSGDPKLVPERVWLLLRRVMQLGVHEIRGDIVLDQSAFAPSDRSAADFDGLPLRPYNVQPAALLLNYRSVLYSFTPDPATGVARVAVEPALARTPVERTVALSAAPCDDWRAALKAEFGAERSAERAERGLERFPERMPERGTRFTGSYPASCGEQTWAVADPQPASYDARLLEAMWRELGGRLAGRVREGAAPAGPPAFEFRSPPLAEVVRDINKFSNNVMAEQLFLTLAAQAGAPGQPAGAAAARDGLTRWLAERLGESVAPGEIVIDNGSGLSRKGRLSARVLARLLVAEFAGPTMSELMSSLPVAALDGTLRRARLPAGRAHLKTGSLDDVAGIAGYLLPASGRRLVLVALIHHPNAGPARPALDALAQAALAGTLGAASGSTPARTRPQAGARGEPPP